MFLWIVLLTYCYHQKCTQGEFPIKNYSDFDGCSIKKAISSPSHVTPDGVSY